MVIICMPYNMQIIAQKKRKHNSANKFDAHPSAEFFKVLAAKIKDAIWRTASIRSNRAQWASQYSNERELRKNLNAEITERTLPRSEEKASASEQRPRIAIVPGSQYSTLNGVQKSATQSR